LKNWSVCKIRALILIPPCSTGMSEDLVVFVRGNLTTCLVELSSRGNSLTLYQTNGNVPQNVSRMEI
jgi:hypothetical protein